MFLPCLSDTYANMTLTQYALCISLLSNDSWNWRWANIFISAPFYRSMCNLLPLWFIQKLCNPVMHKTCNIFYVQTFILTLRIQNFLSIMITVSKCMGCSVTCQSKKKKTNKSSDNTITPSLFPNNLIEVIHVWLCHP